MTAPAFKHQWFPTFIALAGSARCIGFHVRGMPETLRSVLQPHHKAGATLRIDIGLHRCGLCASTLTHDMAIAQYAQRIIEISDGRLVADRLTGIRSMAPGVTAPQARQLISSSDLEALRARFAEAFRMALRAMNAHRMCTFLTMLGISIGIASVVSVVALGTGARQAILSNISSLGTNTTEIYPGSGFGEACQKNPLTPFINSEAIAQDMDLLRSVLGDEKIS